MHAKTPENEHTHETPKGTARISRQSCARETLADTIIAALRERAMLAKPAPTWTDLDREIL